MPFDTTKLRQPTVTLLPPTPPERGGGPQRIHIEIEIVDFQAQHQPRRYRFGTVTLTLLIIVLLATLLGCTAVHAQPSNWRSYREGFMTRYQGTDRDGGQWTGQSYKQGFMTYFDANGPHVEQQHCRSWQQGWQSFTDCQ
jgi:hypothetical protein